MNGYFNNAIIGNGSILACLTEKGALQRLFWPDIDYLQQIESYKIGISFDNMGWDTLWIDGEDFVAEQKYEEKAAILFTTLKNTKLGLEIELQDYVIWDKDLYIRNVKVLNSGPFDTVLSIILYQKLKNSVDNPCSTFYDAKSESVIYARRDCYMAVSANVNAQNIIIGGGLANRAEKRIFDIIDNSSMGSEAIFQYELGLLNSGQSKEITVFHSLSKEINKSLEIFKYYKSSKNQQMKEIVISNWKNFYNTCRNINTDDKLLNKIYDSTLISFRLLTNKTTGAMIAAPEMDEEHSKCGGYGYCWCRDAGFIATAMELCGMYLDVENFYIWASKVQSTDGFWFQRYYTDGNVAPSWGFQIDETGTILWGILSHFESREDKEFLNKMWPSVKKAANFLVEFIDENTKLPHLSFDLWEERLGEHAYSSAAVCEGLKAAVQISKILQMNGDEIISWNKYAAELNNNIKGQVLFFSTSGYFK